MAITTYCIAISISIIMKRITHRKLTNPSGNQMLMGLEMQVRTNFRNVSIKRCPFEPFDGVLLMSG